MSLATFKFKTGDKIWTMLPTLMECLCIKSYYLNNFLAIELNDEPLMGIVLGYSGPGQVAVQFSRKIWKVDDTICDHNNGCHRRGKLDYCMYIPEEFLIPCPVSGSSQILSPLLHDDPPSMLSALESPTQRRNQLLLLL